MLENPSATVYGTLVVAALLDAETARAQTYLRSVAGIVLALIVYWVAHAYASATGSRLEHGEPLRAAELAETARHELMFLLGAVLPLAVVVFCWIAGLELATALVAGVSAAALMVVTFEVLVAVRAELRGRELAGQLSVGIALGLLVVVLRLVLH